MSKYYFRFQFIIILAKLNEYSVFSVTRKKNQFNVLGYNVPLIISVFIYLSTTHYTKLILRGVPQANLLMVLFY